MTLETILPVRPRHPDETDLQPTKGQHCMEEGDNPVMLQAFEWNLPADHQHWKRLRGALPELKAIGVDTLWLPPGSKGKDAESSGYDIYDAYDLGEFDQKGTVPTKWGTKQELVDLAKDSRALGMGLLWDAILNHRAFADSTEMVKVVEVDPRDRRRDITECKDIEAWTKFDYTARGGKYSSFTYDKRHFNGTDWDEQTKDRKIYRFVEDGKNWAQDVGTLQGNADYLMLENLDYTNAEVIEETNGWGKWITSELQLKGFRLDAVMHYSRNFLDRWANMLRATADGRLFFVGEYWHGDVRELHTWLDHMSPHICLYDVPLMFKIHRLSTREDSDLRRVFDDTLVQTRPQNAVTFVRNHDTQRGQAMATQIERAFTAHANSLLLLRRDGIPCVFHGDLYGIGAPYPEAPTCGGKLPGIILARKLYAYGPQKDYFERSDCIGWTRQGTSLKPDGVAVILSWSNHSEPENIRPKLRMYVGKRHAGETWTDVLGLEWKAVVINEHGFGMFPCQMDSMACFVNQNAQGRERFPVQFDSEYFQEVKDVLHPAHL